MRVAFVYNEIPNREHSTDSYCSFLLVKTMVEAGLDVDAVLLLSERSLGDPATRQRWLREFEGLGAQVNIMPGDVPRRTYRIPGGRFVNAARRLLSPDISDYFAHTALSEDLAPVLQNLSPDVIFIWGNWPALAATWGMDIAPIFAFMGDPPHVVGFYRTRPPFVSKRDMLSLRTWYVKLSLVHVRRFTLLLLSQCNAVAATSAHHAEWYRQNGLPDCKYLPNIVPDWGGPDWQERRSKQGSNVKLKIMLLGNLAGTVNYSGCHLFVNETLPGLERELGDSFEVHIYGNDAVADTIPESLLRKLGRPSVHLRGFVPDIVSELFSSDVLVVPTPIPLGIRVRIPYAWSTGCCVIAHNANASGLPELVHDQNALLAPTGEALAFEIIKIAHDKELRQRLGVGGRQTYDSSFAYNVTSRKFLSELESVARKG